MTFGAMGLLLNSALYIAGCFIAGLVTHHGAAWRLAIATAGVTYLSYFYQNLPGYNLGLAKIMVAASIGLGALAGLLLLVP